MFAYRSVKVLAVVGSLMLPGAVVGPTSAVAQGANSQSIAQRIARSSCSDGSLQQLISSLVAARPAAASDVIAALNQVINRIENNPNLSAPARAD